MIIKSNPKEQLKWQIRSFYGEGENHHLEVIDEVYNTTLISLDYCFSHIKNKYYHFNGETIFNPLHVAQWTMFLYQIAHHLIILSSDYTDLCDKIYGISKCFSSADIYYEVNMPDIWFFDHPQGSVMGRAEYSNYFSFSQSCTVGNNKGKYPRFGSHVSMMSGSKVLGDCTIGDHVIFAANSYLLDKDVPSYSIVFGSGAELKIYSISPKRFTELTSSMFDE